MCFELRFHLFFVFCFFFFGNYFDWSQSLFVDSCHSWGIVLATRKMVRIENVPKNRSYSFFNIKSLEFDRTHALINK